MLSIDPLVQSALAAAACASDLRGTIYIILCAFVAYKINIFLLESFK